MTAPISPAVCIASPFRMISPFFAEREEAPIKAIGIASPNAQGHAITSVATKTKRLCERASAFALTQGIAFSKEVNIGLKAS